MTQAPPFREEEDGARPSLQMQLAELISRNCQRRDDERYVELADRAQVQEEGDAEPFAADLVLREEDGFELWLGSLEDALSLRALADRGVNAFLNCAQEECERECAAFRVGRGRSRCHARGPSAMTDAFWPSDGGASHSGRGSVEETQALSRELVRALALFDGEWYASMLGYETAYLGFAADDEPGYSMASHFSEAVAFLERCRAERRKVLVHCIMGVNRSAAALVAFLCGGLGMSLGEAVALTARRRGQVLSNGSFLGQLAEAYGHREDCSNMEEPIQCKCSFAADLNTDLTESVCAPGTPPCIR